MSRHKGQLCLRDNSSTCVTGRPGYGACGQLGRSHVPESTSPQANSVIRFSARRLNLRCSWPNAKHASPKPSPADVTFAAPLLPWRSLSPIPNLMSPTFRFSFWRGQERLRQDDTACATKSSLWPCNFQSASMPMEILAKGAGQVLTDSIWAASFTL